MKFVFRQAHLTLELLLVNMRSDSLLWIRSLLCRGDTVRRSAYDDGASHNSIFPLVVMLVSNKLGFNDGVILNLFFTSTSRRFPPILLTPTGAYIAAIVLNESLEQIIPTPPHLPYRSFSSLGSKVHLLSSLPFSHPNLPGVVVMSGIYGSYEFVLYTSVMYMCCNCSNNSHENLIQY